MKSSILLLLAGSLCLGQSTGLPQLGWVRGDEPGRYQRVVGVAGAAQVDGQAALAVFEVLSIRPRDGMAAVVLEDGAVALARLDGSTGEGALQRLPGALESPGLAAWSPSGDALLLAAPARQQLQIWKMEGADAALLREIPMAAESAAVSDGGGRILALADGVLYRMDEDGALLEVSRNAAAFTFVAGGERYAWIEGSMLHLSGPGAEVQPVELEEQENGVRLLASAGHGMLLLAESAGGEARLRLWNSEGELAGEWRCPAEITGMRASGVAGVLHLAAHGEGPVWMADLGAVQPSVFFVPRPAELQRQGGDQ